MTFDSAFNADGRSSLGIVLYPVFAAMLDAERPGWESDPELAPMLEAALQPISTVVDGRTAYMRGELVSMWFETDTEWVSLPVPRDWEAPFVSLGIEPGAALARSVGELAANPGESEITSTSGTIEGSDVTTYTWLEDAERVRALVGGDSGVLAGLPPEMLDGDLELELAVSDDGEPLQAVIEGLQRPLGVRMTLTIVFADLGRPVTIDLPERHEVTRVSQEQLEAL